jgi:hypothetical protein
VILLKNGQQVKELLGVLLLPHKVTVTKAKILTKREYVKGSALADRYAKETAFTKVMILCKPSKGKSLGDFEKKEWEKSSFYPSLRSSLALS